MKLFCCCFPGLFLISTHKGKEEIPVRTSHDLQWKKEKKLQVKED